MAAEVTEVDAGMFFREYHGHPLDDLRAIHRQLSPSAESTIFLVGDSSLDNKHWFFNTVDKAAQLRKGKDVFIGDAINGYDLLLQPPKMVKDVSYWMNFYAEKMLNAKGKIVTINCAVEESTIGQRMQAAQEGGSGLLPHDEFVREHVGGNDVIVLSLGGNDVALRPTPATIASVFALTRMPMPLLQLMGRFTPGFSHLERLFHAEVEQIIQRMMPDDSPSSSSSSHLSPRKPPALVVVCMLYYLDQKPGGSWADHVLNQLGYDTDPAKVQLIIRLLFERIQSLGFHVTSKSGEVKVLPFPFFEILDGTDTGDYVQRVEPSVEGGRKMAEALINFIFEHSAKLSLQIERQAESNGWTK